MDKVIKMLREQMILCSRLIELFEKLNTALKENTSGAGVSSSVQAIEPMMMELSKNDVKVQNFLKTNDVPNIKEFIETQPESIERNVANNLLIKINDLQKRLQHQITNAAALLIKSKTFIDYNLNMMSRTVASNTYGPPGASAGSPIGRRMFDKNV